MGPQGDGAGRRRDARSDGASCALRRQGAARGCARDGLAPHDDPDRRADRDARRAWRRRALGVVQHLLDPGSRGGRGRCRPARDARHGERAARHSRVRVEGRVARRLLVVHEGSARLARRLRSHAHRRRRRRRHALRSQGPRVRKGWRGPGVQSRHRTRGVGRHSRNASRRAEAVIRACGRGSPRASAASQRKPRRASIGSTR